MYCHQSQIKYDTTYYLNELCYYGYVHSLHWLASCTSALILQSQLITNLSLNQRLDIAILKCAYYNNINLMLCLGLASKDKLVKALASLATLSLSWGKTVFKSFLHSVIVIFKQHWITIRLSYAWSCKTDS